jgi:hypothetical protein
LESVGKKVKDAEEAPSGTLRLGGVGIKLVLRLLKFTITPPAGAGWLKVTVAITVSPGATLARVKASDTIGSAGVAGVTVRVAERDE